MNASLRVAVLSLSALGLVACTGMEEKSTYVEPVPVDAAQQAGIEQDDAYIAEVERIARRRGVHVQWVNPPTKRVVATQ